MRKWRKHCPRRRLQSLSVSWYEYHDTFYHRSSSSACCPYRQRCYEQKQYKQGLKHCKTILSQPQFANHGGWFPRGAPDLHRNTVHEGPYLQCSRQEDGGIRAGAPGTALQLEVTYLLACVWLDLSIRSKLPRGGEVLSECVEI